MAEKKNYSGYRNQWISENYDRVNLLLPKGQKLELQTFAASLDKSLNAFIQEAIEEKVKREKIALEIASRQKPE